MVFMYQRSNSFSEKLQAFFTIFASHSLHDNMTLTVTDVGPRLRFTYRPQRLRLRPQRR